MRRAILLLALPLLLSGCLGYKLGPSNGTEAGSRSIQIRPIQNNTLEPQLTDALSYWLRREVQRDGTYRLDTKGDGDVIVTTTIMRYDRQAVTFEPRDTLTVRDYRVQLHAHVTAYDRVSGKTVVDKDFRGHTVVRVGRDQASAERQAVPVLTEDLGRRIAAAIFDGEW